MQRDNQMQNVDCFVNLILGVSSLIAFHCDVLERDCGCANSKIEFRDLVFHSNACSSASMRRACVSE